MSLDFDKQNAQDWITIQKEIFPAGIPLRCEWSDREIIVSILKKIGAIENSNHMFFPTGGGLDIENANLAAEKDCIEIDTGGLYDIIKPHRLIFNSFNASPQWNYFRLEAAELKPSGVYKYEDESEEELAELEPGRYVSRTYFDQMEYHGEQLPSTARVVTRHLRGAFVIFQKTSIYNRNSRTYDGRHNKMSDEEFRNYIQKQVDHLTRSDWNE